MQLRRYKGLAIESLYYFFGSLFYSIGIYTFAKDAGFAPGGFSGLALICNYLWDMPIGITTLLFNIPAVIFSYKVLGRAFMLKSFIVMGICTILLDLVFPFFPVYSDNGILCVIYSGIFVGVGLALIYMRGASSGGTDFITLAVKVLCPYLSIGFVGFTFDIVVILLGWPVFGTVDSVLYGFASTAIACLVIDKIMYGIGAGKLVLIITDKGQDIAHKVGTVIQRGSTLLQGIGTYTKKNKHVLLCACAKTEIYDVCTIAREIDPSAFAMVTETSEVFGLGFIEGGINSQAMPTFNKYKSKKKNKFFRKKQHIDKSNIDYHGL